jgi:rhamnosyltransferase
MRAQGVEMTPGPSHDTVCTVIVTFHPQAWLFDLLPALRALALRTVVVDNGSPAEAVDRLRALAAEAGIELIANDANLGIAAALNQGVRRARERGAAWALLLDQDTDVAPNILEGMAAALADFADPGRVAVIGANYGTPDEPRGRYPIDEAANRRFSVQIAVITSGSLVAVPAFDKIGPFAEELFIDQVDHEYCLRARGLGFTIIATRDVLLKHSIGKESAHPFLGRIVITSNHPPARRYYMARNAVVVARRYLSAEPRWVAAMLRRTLRDLVAMLLFEHDRGPKLKWWVHGLWHGMRGKLGPIANINF